MKKLISMTDFVLEQQKEHLSLRDFNIKNYAKFLKQPLELWMFVPCDEDGNVLELPTKENSLNTIDHESKMMDYREAKERCLFEGFSYDGFKYVERLNYCINIKNIERMTIEELVKRNLQLTKTALKQIGL